jgi:hypothetical protein
MSTILTKDRAGEMAREWIRENLEVVVSYQSQYGPDHSAYVGLRFKGESEPFTKDLVVIPTLPEDYE